MPQQTTPIKPERWQRTTGVAFRAAATDPTAAGAIDAEQGIIPDVVMAQEGQAQGHGFGIEAEFIEQMVAYDKRHFSKTGLKARFGHPSASPETMGTRLGVFYNFRTRQSPEGKMQAIADLHLLQAADISPTHPNTRSWMLQMAAERPDFVMSSIVFSPSRYYQRRESGVKKYVPADEYGYLMPDPELGEIFAEFGADGRHYYTDIVEQGAVTDNLFSSAANPHLFVSQALTFLRDHPHLEQFIRANPEKVHDFLRQLGVDLSSQPREAGRGTSPIQPTKPKRTTMPNLKEWLFGKDEPAEDVLLSTEDLKQLRTKLADVETKLTALETKLADASKEVDALKATLAERDKELADANARIAELEKKPAAEHTSGPTEAPATDDASKKFTGDPATQKAIAEYQRMQALKKA